MKKLLSVVLALVLVLGLAVVPAFADETTAPTGSTTATHPGITSVTVNGTTAYYQYDNNTGSGVVYIRAKMPNTSTWGSLQSATVVITTTGNAPSVAYNGSPITTPTPSGNAYTYTNMDLLNKRYSVTVADGGNTYTYYLAAGFTNKVAISNSDSLGLVSAVIGNSNDSNISVYGSVVQNAYMGNTYYVNNNINWTDTNVAYYVAGQFSSANAVADVTLSLGSGASLVSGGCIYTSGTSYKYNPNIGGTFSVTNGSGTRTYTVTAQNNSSEVIISADNFKINMSELSGDTEFDDLVLEIEDALSDFYDECAVNADYLFYTTDSLMDVMLAFIDFAESEGYFSGYTYCSDTYLSTLNDIGEFSAGDYSGWMYIDGEYAATCGVPMIGAADYPLGDPSNVFTWFFTTDYRNHYSF